VREWTAKPNIDDGVLETFDFNFDVTVDFARRWMGSFGSEPLAVLADRGLSWVEALESRVNS
jgi:hypothetical protein